MGPICLSVGRDRNTADRYPWNVLINVKNNKAIAYCHKLKNKSNIGIKN